MLKWLALLFIVAPAAELAVLVAIGHQIGVVTTFTLLILSGFIGAYLVKREARRVWEYANSRLARGEIPTDSILDGICIFVGGAFLLAPGFLSDLIGLLFVLPVTRPALKLLLLRWLQVRIGRGTWAFFRRR